MNLAVRRAKKEACRANAADTGKAAASAHVVQALLAADRSFRISQLNSQFTYAELARILCVSLRFFCFFCDVYDKLATIGIIWQAKLSPMRNR